MKNIYFILTLLLIVQNAIAIELGTLDTSFSSDGWDSEGTGADPFYNGSDIHIDSQGRIIVSGFNTEEINGNHTGIIFIKRYLGDGQVDTSFGTNGKIKFQQFFGSFSFYLNYRVRTALTANDDIVLAFSSRECDTQGNNCHTDDDVFIKYIKNNGNNIYEHIVAFNFGNSTSRNNDQLKDMLLDETNNKIILAVEIEMANAYDIDFGIASVNIDTTTGSMSMDTNFSSDGLTNCYFDQGSTTDPSLRGHYDVPEAIVYNPVANSYIISGAAYEGNGDISAGENMAFCEFSPQGNVNRQWSSKDSPLFTATNVEYAVESAIVTQNGVTSLLVAATSSNISFSSVIMIVKYNYNINIWELDTNFATNGIYTVDFSNISPEGYSSDRAKSIAIQSNGSIIIAGFSYYYSSGTSTDNINFAFAKVNASGKLDTTWAQNGLSWVHSFDSPRLDELDSFVIDSPTGAIYLVGTNRAVTNAPAKMIVAKLHNDVIFAHGFDF